MHAAGGEGVALTARGHLRPGQCRQRRVGAIALADDVTLEAHLLTRDAAVLAPPAAAASSLERVPLVTAAVRLPDTHVLARPDAERRREAGRHVEAFGEREGLRVGRVDDDADALARRHGALGLVQARQHTHLCRHTGRRGE